MTIKKCNITSIATFGFILFRNFFPFPLLNSTTTKRHTFETLTKVYFALILVLSCITSYNKFGR